MLLLLLLGSAGCGLRGSDDWLWWSRLEGWLHDWAGQELLGGLVENLLLLLLVEDLWLLLESHWNHDELWSLVGNNLSWWHVEAIVRLVGLLNDWSCLQARGRGV